MILFTIIFIFLLFLCIFDFVHSKYKYIAFIAVGLCLLLLSGLRPPYTDKDYSNYLRWFNTDMKIGKTIAEPSFVLISSFVHRFLFGNPQFLFFIYAAIAVSIKFYAIKQLSDYLFLSILLYFSYSFLLQDFTQIRAGVATGILLLAIKPLYERKMLKFILLSLLAVSFHYSAIVMIFLLFLNPQKINTTAYAVALLAAYLFYFAARFTITNLIYYIPGGVLVEKLTRYEYQNGTALNIFNSWQLIRCGLSFFFLYSSNEMFNQNKYSFLFIKIYLVATICFVVVASNPAIAGRVSDFFAIIDIVIIPCVVGLVFPKTVGFIVVTLIALSYLILNLYFNKIILA